MSKIVMKEIPLDKIHWETRYRDDLGDLDAMAESIREKGVIQPISVKALDGGEYWLLAGERRVRSSLLAERTTIPAVIRETAGDADEREIELYENVFRKDFTWDERVKLVAEIDRLNKARNVNWSMRKTAELLGYGVATVSRQTQLAAALEAMPELAEVAHTEAEALKVVKKLEEKHVTQLLAERQAERVGKAEFDFLELANNNYQIGDALKELAALRTNGRIDFIECDPPYGIELNDIKRKDSATSTVDSYQEVATDKYEAFLIHLAKELFRVAGPNCWMVFWFGPTNHQIVKLALEDAGWQVNDIPALWVKPNGQTMQPNTNLANCYEPFFVCRKGVPALAKQGRSNVFQFNPVPGSKKYHPTQRPIELACEIVTTFCHLGSIVLVPFLGSGSTLRACYLEGMKGYGYDLNDEYKSAFMLAVEDDLRHLNGEDDE